MVKLRVVAVGGIKESFYREAIAEYVKRLGKWAKVEILEAEEASRIDDPTAKAGAEADGILRRLKGRTVLLDVKGRRITSEGIADLLKRYVNAGDSEITFVIGGSNGVAQAVKDRADEVISFGDITLPHQLFRVVLLEQLYRAETILHNAAYHK
ncbi:MAG: 23S rRNA (pseudouridine(1915)-N(3))-methyltransferase RlmH [Clostridia bacterium]|nr:23S rRNA (pseudouridine(1915)-N(3))-methyltransferase RlmH [Clostridia bacterium]